MKYAVEITKCGSILEKEDIGKRRVIEIQIEPFNCRKGLGVA